MLNTKNIKPQKPTTEQRKTIVKEFESYHEVALNILSDIPPMFYPKNPFLWKDELCVSLYAKEITAPLFYTELVDENYMPSDVNRSLYKFAGNVNYINEYFAKKETFSGVEYVRYYVPLLDFNQVNLNILFEDDIEKIETDNQFLMTEKKTSILIEEDDRIDYEDALMSKMTIKDHIAIKWRLPLSNKEWLNNIIKKHG